jgi:hypothetical protein
MSLDAKNAAKNHTSVLDRVKYTSADITDKMLAGLFDVEKLVVATAQYDSAKKGVTASIGSIFPSEIVWLGFVNPTPSPKAPSAMYTFKSNMPPVRTWRDEERKAEAVEVQKKLAPKVVASLTGYLIKDVI